MSAKITKNIGPVKNDSLKRFYLDGLDVDVSCPKCGHKVCFNTCFNYPAFNQFIEVALECACVYEDEGCECGHVWSLEGKLKLSFEIVKEHPGL